MSSADAVTCVQMWLEKNKPTNFLAEQKKSSWFPSFAKPAQTSTSAAEMDDDNDTYYDETEQCLKWRVSPKHFVVEDENCGVHLVKNALGGKRRDLFLGIMTVQPPLSRAVRDDITVHVVFFGVDTENLPKF